MTEETKEQLKKRKQAEAHKRWRDSPKGKEYAAKRRAKLKIHRMIPAE